MSRWAVPDKNQTGIEDILFWTPSFLGNFKFVTFILTNSRENKLSLLEILQKFCKIVCHTLEFQSQKPRPMEILRDFFLNSPGNSTSFFITSGISTFFLQYPWKFHQIPFGFFWNSSLLFMYPYFPQVMIWSILYAPCVHDLLRPGTSVQV